MGCCKAEKYKWCKELDTVYTDEEGKEYCVFHAPKGHKGVSLEEFNNLVFQRIEEAKNSGQECNLSGTIFEGEIIFTHFDKENPLPDIDFSFITFFLTFFLGFGLALGFGFTLGFLGLGFGLTFGFAGFFFAAFLGAEIAT